MDRRGEEGRQRRAAEMGEATGRTERPDPECRLLVEGEIDESKECITVDWCCLEGLWG